MQFERFKPSWDMSRYTKREQMIHCSFTGSSSISLSPSSETLQSFQLTLSGKFRKEGLATTSLQESELYQSNECARVTEGKITVKV